ncbi:MAG: hypothetical protein PVJ07_09305, partial [Anaerolineales bacterium]
TMQVMIGAIRAFTEKCVRGVEANRAKAEGWLEKNSIVVTAINPLVGYAEGARLVKEAMARGVTIRELALEKAGAGELRHRQQDRPITEKEIEAALSDMRKMTEGGIAG